MTTNEAAERLLDQLLRELVTEVLAAERRATVERIRAAVTESGGPLYVPRGSLLAILDEEAAR